MVLTAEHVDLRGAAAAICPLLLDRVISEPLTAGLRTRQKSLEETLEERTDCFLSLEATVGQRNMRKTRPVRPGSKPI